MTELRFGVLSLPDEPFPALVQRWQAFEAAGIDHLWLPDHTHDYRGQAGFWFDGWTALAVAATATTRIRLGTLVSNPILRGPAMLAKQAASVDHLSGGRLELGIGTGIAPFDHAATGVPYWAPRERAARFAEYVSVVDELLRAAGSGTPYAFAGEHHRVEGATLSPATVQRPRPPITVGGQSPTVRRVALERADCWNTHGPFGLGVDDIVALTREQNADMDQRCEAAGRDPASLRRSVLLFGALDEWQSPGELEGIVEAFVGAGVAEFVLSEPAAGERRSLFERVVGETLLALRAQAAGAPNQADRKG